MNRTKISFVTFAAVALLFLAFIGSSIASISLGTQAKTSETAFLEQSYSQRTLLSFIAEKLRQSDGRATVYVGSFDGANALFLEQELEGVLYTDIIYCFDGFLCELLCEKSAGFSREDGTKLIKTGSVIFSSPESGMICVEVTSAKGKQSSLCIQLRSGGLL